ncbi:hypothetical protein HPB48_018013 [Haemaphysalis longicornis]|uniref:Uncharacterized protein n=1 Tax=Haemaphysalis longicornis TaxID=44386 RepID=A0A9J6FJ52_HAELO|nr:hypothetical protein HPB48_018013 [Haemaphysalis longicornis]
MNYFPVATRLTVLFPINRLVNQYADCISAIVPSGECPDVAFKLKTDAQRSVHTEGFQVCRSSSVKPIAFLIVGAVCFYLQRLHPD